MALLTRAHYVSLLTKLASEGESSVPEINNQETAHGELKSNVADSRDTLSGLFTQFAAAQKGSTAEVKKLFPKFEKDESSSPLLKIASWPYIQAMNASFLNELEKIGYRDVMTSAPTATGVVQRAPTMTGDTLRQFRSITGSGGAAARTAAPAQAARFGASHGLAPAVAARRATAAAKGSGGILSRLFRAAA